MLSCVWFYATSSKFCLVMRLMNLGTTSLSRTFYLRVGFRLIYDLTALIACVVRHFRIRPDILQSFTFPMSGNDSMVHKKNFAYSAFMKNNNGNTVLFVWPFHREGPIHVYWNGFGRLESTYCITFGCVQVITCKSCFYIFINIYDFSYSYFFYFFNLSLS